MKYVCLLAAVAAAAVALVPPATATERHVARVPDSNRVVMRQLLKRITVHRDETWHWQRLMHHKRYPFAGTVLRNHSLAYRRWVLNLWVRRDRVARRNAYNPPHKAEWLCIHRYEGSWTDPNAPYFGGLQMDMEFQATYGADLLRTKGTANHWTPLEQMWVAERAFPTRGYWPWPNTARDCGLLG